MGLGEYGDRDLLAVNYWMFEYSSDQVALLTAQLGLAELSKLEKVENGFALFVTFAFIESYIMTVTFLKVFIFCQNVTWLCEKDFAGWSGGGMRWWPCEMVAVLWDGEIMMMRCPVEHHLGETPQCVLTLCAHTTLHTAHDIFVVILFWKTAFFCRNFKTWHF